MCPLSSGQIHTSRHAGGDGQLGDSGLHRRVSQGRTGDIEIAEPLSPPTTGDAGLLAGYVQQAGEVGALPGIFVELTQLGDGQLAHSS